LIDLSPWIYVTHVVRQVVHAVDVEVLDVVVVVVDEAKALTGATTATEVNSAKVAIDVRARCFMCSPFTGTITTLRRQIVIIV
jgi:hypothetical protein